MRAEYYISPNSENPVSDFLDTLNKKQQAKLLRIISNIEVYGLNSVIPHLKKLIGTPFWEIRVLGGDNLRIIYIAQCQEFVLLLHGFKKKSQKTSPKEIKTAENRYQDWKLDKRHHI